MLMLKFCTYIFIIKKQYMINTFQTEYFIMSSTFILYLSIYVVKFFFFFLVLSIFRATKTPHFLDT